MMIVPTMFTMFHHESEVCDEYIKSVEKGKQMSNNKVTPIKQRPNVKPTILPALVLNDEKKVTVIEYEWNGKTDRFAMFVEGQKAMVNVHMRQYEYHLDKVKKRKAVVYVLADDRLSDEQLGTLISSMGPWFYTYGMRIEG